MPDVSLDSLTAIDWLINLLVVGSTIAVFAILWSPRLRQSRYWRATVTPLASIIGSGFLVVAPLLGYTVGHWAFVAMLGIVATAYAVGGAVRYNICHVEDVGDSDQKGNGREQLIRWLERSARMILALAYVIGITFYLELMAAFLLHLFDLKNQVFQKSVATGLVIFIGVFGFWRGLSKLESLEKYAVDTKLAVIAGFLVGLTVLNIYLLTGGDWSLPTADIQWNVETFRKLLGAFLIVQGFETSRYMGSVYSADERARSMRFAQLLSAAIYLAFIGLASVLLGKFSSISETGIISLSSQVAMVLPYLLIIGAATAQFSAAVADTLASGGLIEVATAGKVPHRYVYLAIMLLATGLLWTSHIFSIIAYASRAFAAYYAIQCAIAAVHTTMAGRDPKSIVRAVFFWLLAILMVITAILGIPAESFGA